MPETTTPSEQFYQPNPSQIVEQECNGYRFNIRLHNDQMECLADLELLDAPLASTDNSEDLAEGKSALCEKDDSREESNNEPPLKTEIMSPAELIQILQKNNINQTIDFESLYQFCAAAAEGISQKGVLLAKGIEPVRGADGWFEIAVKTSADEPEYQEDAKGNVDLRTLHTFTEIEAEQKLGTIHAPHDGIPGMTVNGLPIPAERGNPFTLITGESVILKYNDRIAYAQKAGRALLDKQTLSVVDELVISGDLDLQIGNIDFNGFIEIKGDVPDAFSVKASKGIRVTGTIGACQIESGGPVEIGSMAGKEVGQITSHGDLFVNYLNQATIICYGNVFVRNEIRNSQVKATGRVIVEHGAIIGGKCVALQGIEAKVLGTSSGLLTQLVAGIYFPDADRFDYLHERLKNIDSQLKLIHDALGPMDRIKKLGDTLDNASELRLSILNQQWEKLELEKEQCISEIESSNHQVFDNKNPKINALKAIKEGVVVTLGQSTERFKIGIGPTTLIENTRQGGLRHLSLSPLDKLAAEIEEEVLCEDHESEESQSSSASASPSHTENTGC
ncbi:MAG: FapA family protein [Deltaproteobacteria bacterium]|nr:FapA family protein [Deltaproteobacteria bacterium]